MKFGIIGAMDEEIAGLKSKMEIIETTKIAGCEFFRGQICGREVVLVKCGIGKVNAAVCTQALIDRFAPDYIINTGVAGSMDEKASIGDIIVSNELVQHDFDTTAFGNYEAGQIPRLDMRFFKADERLSRAALGTSIVEHKMLKGRIATGDQFIADKGHKEKIKELFDPLCVEMEGASIAQTCYLNDVPFVVIRAVSDNSDGSADISFEKFLSLAARNSSLIVEEILQSLDMPQN